MCSYCGKQKATRRLYCRCRSRSSPVCESCFERWKASVSYCAECDD